MEKSFIIANKIEEIPVLAGKIEELAKSWGIPLSLSMNINLALEEAVSNIIFYAYNDKENHSINISIALSNNQIVIIIKDDGIPFDPTSYQEPDISLPAEERPIGGLGIFLMLRIMDEISYCRKHDINSLTLKIQMES